MSANSRYSFIRDFSDSPSLALISPGQGSPKSPSFPTSQHHIEVRRSFDVSSEHEQYDYGSPVRRNRNATVQFNNLQSTMPMPNYHWAIAEVDDEIRPVLGPSAWTMPGAGPSPSRPIQLQSQSEPAISTKKPSRLKRFAARIKRAFTRRKRTKKQPVGLGISGPTLTFSTNQFARQYITDQDIGSRGHFSMDGAAEAAGFDFGQNNARND